MILYPFITFRHPDNMHIITSWNQILCIAHIKLYGDPRGYNIPVTFSIYNPGNVRPVIRSSDGGGQDMAEFQLPLIYEVDLRGYHRSAAAATTGVLSSVTDNRYVIWRDETLAQCWATVCDGGPALSQRLLAGVVCLLKGYRWCAAGGTCHANDQIIISETNYYRKEPQTAK